VSLGTTSLGFHSSVQLKEKILFKICANTRRLSQD
jgi:hypothetical protein